MRTGLFPMFIISNQMDTKQQIRMDCCSLGRRLLIQPAGQQSILDGSKVAIDSPTNMMKTRKMAGTVLAITTSVLGKSARYFATVEIPMAKSAPMTLRTVPSSCWARFSWIAKMSSLIARTRNGYEPPKEENGRIVTTREHNRVESILAIARLLTSPVFMRAVLRAGKENMRYQRERGGMFLCRKFRTSRIYGNGVWGERQVTRIALSGLSPSAQAQAPYRLSLTFSPSSTSILTVRSPRS